MRLKLPPFLAFTRFAVGAHLAVHHARVLPYATTLYSREGMLGDPTNNPVPVSISPLHALDAPWAIQGFVAAMVALSVAFAVGLRARTVGVLLAVGQALLWHRNMLTLNPSLAYLGFFLLAFAFSRPASPWSVDRWLERRGGVRAPFGRADALPRDVLGALWLVFTVGYTYSGWTKLVSPSWADGSAVARMLRGPIAQDNPVAHAFAALPDWVLSASTWGVLGLELLAAPLALSRRLRPGLWALLLAMHAGLVLLVGLQDISWGMIVTHLALFDPRWVRRPGTVSGSPGAASHQDEVLDPTGIPALPAVHGLRPGVG